MTKLLSDQEVIQKVLDRISDNTTDLGEQVWRESVDNYRSEKRFAKELDLFKRLPIVFCPSASLEENGSYVARDVAGVPLLAVRGQDGIAGIELDEYGFVPTELQKIGIFSAGVAKRPVDVNSSIQDSTGAALKAIQISIGN